MKIKINNKDIYKERFFVIIKKNKVIYKTYNKNKIKSYIKCMNYLKINDYKVLVIFIDKVRKDLNNDRYNYID